MNDPNEYKYNECKSKEDLFNKDETEVEAEEYEDESKL